jgi:hypothetical protein
MRIKMTSMLLDQLLDHLGPWCQPSSREPARSSLKRREGQRAVRLSRAGVRPNHSPEVSKLPSSKEGLQDDWISRRQGAQEGKFAIAVKTESCGPEHVRQRHRQELGGWCCLVAGFRALRRNIGGQRELEFIVPTPPIGFRMYLEACSLELPEDLVEGFGSEPLRSIAELHDKVCKCRSSSQTEMILVLCSSRSRLVKNLSKGANTGSRDLLTFVVIVRKADDEVVTLTPLNDADATGGVNEDNRISEVNSHGASL